MKCAAAAAAAAGVGLQVDRTAHVSSYLRGAAYVTVIARRLRL